MLFDTGVVLDLLLDRLPHSEAAAGLFSRVESGTITGCLCATTVTTIHYLATKVVGAKRSREEVQKLLSIIEIAPVNRTVLEGALRGQFCDYEDAVIHEAALQVESTAIVTRNVGDFKRYSIPIYSLMELTDMLRSNEGDS